ncbi:MAG: hypothetical protein H6741_08230 [Alphaproteobacteria bacterium]|nr:hypothetical protein [Alphaproteobacteria bacterium]
MLLSLLLLTAPGFAQEAPSAGPADNTTVIVLSPRHMATAEASGVVARANPSQVSPCATYTRFGSRFDTNGADWIVGNRFQVSIEGFPIGEFQEVTLPDIELEEIDPDNIAPLTRLQLTGDVLVVEACEDEPAEAAEDSEAADAAEATPDVAVFLFSSETLTGLLMLQLEDSELIVEEPE